MQLELTIPNKPLVLGPRRLARIQSRQDLVQSLGYFAVIAVMAMFLLDGGISAVIDIPSALDALSRLTSLVGTALMLVMLVLTAKAPWVDAAIGQDNATLAHKKLGKPALYLILTHFVASLVSFAITDGKNVAAELWSLITGVDDMLTATISVLAMIVVVVTSMTFARKRVKYETWFVVHLLSYVSVIAAMPHIFSMGSDVVSNPIHKFVWIFGYLFTGANILIFRLAMPLWRSFSSGLRISRVHRESTDSVTVTVSGKNLNKFSGAAGQFFMLRVLTKELGLQSHPFSISAVPTNDKIRFTIGDRGDATKLIQKLRPGARVILEGPFGIFTEARRTRVKTVLIGAGIGVVPIRALAEGLHANPGDITIIYRTRDPADSPLLEELKEISALRGHDLRLVTGKRPKSGNWLVANGTDEQGLQQLVPNIKDADVYVCGPVALTKQVEKSLEKLHLPKVQIHTEEFAW